MRHLGRGMNPNQSYKKTCWIGRRVHQGKENASDYEKKGLAALAGAGRDREQTIIAAKTPIAMPRSGTQVR